MHKKLIWFNIFVHPISNKFVPADGIDDADPSDDYAANDQQPYSQNDEIEMDDDGYRHSRSICVELYKPKMAKRHIIKLGNVDPQPLFWKRAFKYFFFGGKIKVVWYQGLYLVVIKICSKIMQSKKALFKMFSAAPASQNF
uniref:Uncharacterized protein n=1 Tax=Globodera rostochiensis TaxID=31243 RepID=A0A914HHU6_GLORO